MTVNACSMMRITLPAAGIASLGVAWIAHGVAASPIRQPDVGRGATIAAHGVPPRVPHGVPACAQCHSPSGGSDGGGAFPRIAGQSLYYLDQQMRDFASGVRVNAVMTPIAKELSAEEIADVTAYYASVTGPFLPLTSGDPNLIKRGEQLAKIGDASRDLQSCNDCHGPDGAGEPPAIPYLAGQYAHYISSQLQAWRLGSRRSSPDSMEYVAKRLGDPDIEAVAMYFQQVRTAAQPIQSKE
jgi:cytochrome c553